MSSKAVVIEAHPQGADPGAVRQVLGRILASNAFAKAMRSKVFLRYIVEKSLSGDLEALNENVIAQEVFERADAFDPKLNSRVRTGANRLRRLLALYYKLEGRAQDILISLPIGSYVPVFEPRVFPTFAQSTVPRRRAFVGRRDELANLESLVSESLAGQSRLVCIVAEPGVGKTALIEALLDRHPQTRATRAQCRLQFQQGQPYQVWLDLLAELTMSDTTVKNTLRKRAPHWFGLLQGQVPVRTESSPNILRREAERFLQDLTSADPVILVLDDLHWADSASIELLGQLVPGVASLPLAIIAAYRPSLTLQRELSIHQRCRVLPLPLLTRADVHEYLNICFPSHQIGVSAANSLFRASSGNPLCLADMVQHAQTNRWIVRGEDGVWTFTARQDVWTTELPSSVSEMAAKKLDELDDDARDLLWKCSIQGVVFDAAIAATTLGIDPVDVERRLDRLASVHRIVTRLPSRASASRSVRYEFSHFLYFDALDRQERFEERRRLSALIAQAITGRPGESDEDTVPVLARLFEQAGVVSQARQFYLRSAARALGVSAFREVYHLTERALSLTLERPPTDQDLRCQMTLLTFHGLAGMTLYGFEFGPFEKICGEAESLAATLGDTSAALGVRTLQWALTASGNYGRAQLVADSILKDATAAGDSTYSVYGGFALGVSLLHMGRFGPSEAALARAHELWSLSSDDPEIAGFGVSTGMAILCNWARALWFLGFPDRALATVLRASEIARVTDRKKNAAYAAALVADIYHLRRENEQAIAWADRAISIAAEEDFVYELQWATFFKAFSLTESGHPAAALELSSGLLSQYRGPCRSKHLSGQAWALGLSGAPQAGLSLLDDAMMAAEDRQEIYWNAELMRLRGELMMLGDRTSANSVDACHQFRKAAEMARTQGARILELRALTSLLRIRASASFQDVNGPLTRLRQLVESLEEGSQSRDVRNASELLRGVWS